MAEHVGEDLTLHRSVLEALDAEPDALVITTFAHADEILDRMGLELKDSVRVAAL